MYSQRRSGTMSIPEAPIYPVIEKVNKKPVKVSPIKHVNVGDILVQNSFDEAI